MSEPDCPWEVVYKFFVVLWFSFPIKPIPIALPISQAIHFLTSTLIDALPIPPAGCDPAAL